MYLHVFIREYKTIWCISDNHIKSLFHLSSFKTSLDYPVIKWPNMNIFYIMNFMNERKKNNDGIPMEMHI